MTTPVLRTQHLDVHLPAVEAALRTNLNTYIDLVNAVQTDGILIPHVPAENIILGGMQPIPTLTDKAPAIEVAIPSFDLDNLDLNTTDAEETLIALMRCWVKYTGDASTAVRDVYLLNTRLSRAVLACVVPQANNSWGNGAVVQRVRGRYKADPETDTREAWTSSVILEFTLDSVDLF